MVEVLAPAVSQGFKHRWVPFIQQVYEARPLFCSQCGSAMRIIAFIEQLEVTEKILSYLGLWPAPAHSSPESIAA